MQHQAWPGDSLGQLPGLEDLVTDDLCQEADGQVRVVPGGLGQAEVHYSLPVIRGTFQAQRTDHYVCAITYYPLNYFREAAPQEKAQK